MLKTISYLNLIVALLFALAVHTVNAQSAKTILAEVSGQVLDLGGKPVIGAIVHLDGPTHVQNSADATGHFIFANVPPGIYTITVDAPGFTTLSRPNVAVQNEDVSLDIRLSLITALKEIGHVSTTSGRSSMNVTAATSYDLSPTDMAFQGQTQWQKILEEVPGVSVSNVACCLGAAVSDSPARGQIVSIRGALPYETAMLIDNMPMYASSFGVTSGGGGTDLAPYDPQSFSAFDVIEGPGAQSPSIIDSIGGSVNLHPAGQVTENRYNFSIQNDPYGGWISNWFAAIRAGRLSATATYGFDNSPGPLGASASPQYMTLIYSQLGTVNGQAFSCNVCQGYIYPPGAGYLGNYSGLTTGLVACCSMAVSTGWREHSGSLSLFYQVSPAIIAQAFYSGQSQNVPTPYGNYPTTFIPPAGYTGAFPAGTSLQNSINANSIQDQQVSDIYEGKMIFALGHGQLQLAALENYSRMNESDVDINPSSLQLFGGGVVGGSPMVFNGASYPVTFPQCVFNFNYATDNRDLSASYTTVFGGNFRGALSYVHSYYDNPSSTFFSFDGFSFGSQPQENFEATDELRLGLGVDPSARTSLDLSTYLINAHYHVIDPVTHSVYVDPDFHYATPRLAFVWRPISSLAIRASAGGGIALAPLAQMVGSNSVPFCYLTICTETIENLGLQPEKSSGVDLGFDKRFAGNTILSFDAYRTDLYGQIYSFTEQTGTFGGLPLFTTENGNLGHSRYEGVEVDLRHDVAHGVTWSVSGSLMRGYVVSVPPDFYNTSGGVCDRATGVNCTNLTVVTGANFNGTFGPISVPYAQGYALYGYRWSPDRFVNVDAHYFGNNNGYFRPAFMVFDANLSMPLTNHVAIQGTLRNITGIFDSVYQNYGEGVVEPTIGVGGVYSGGYYIYATNYEPRTFVITLRIH